MWEPRPLTPLWAFTACYRESFSLLTFLLPIWSDHYANLFTLSQSHIYKLRLLFVTENPRTKVIEKSFFTGCTLGTLDVISSGGSLFSIDNFACSNIAVTYSE
jgi:hypothetical protein